MADVAKQGSLIQVDSGEYSDYDVHGFFVALADFKPMLELDKYLHGHPKEKKEYQFNRNGFLAYLVAQGYLLEIGRSILYLGSYSSSEDVEFRPYGGEDVEET